MRRDPVTPLAGSHALVIGGSMAGLLAARVLAAHFERVSIVERDRFPDAPEHRKGVPQARHIHILLMRGWRILEQFFPGLEDELIAAGAQRIDIHNEFAWHNSGGWARRFASSHTILGCSRDFLEWSIRRRLAASRRIAFLEETEVTGLLANSDKSRVVGVRVRHRDRQGEENAAEDQLYADLVVDASGRSSRAPQWLEALGYEAPEETEVNSFLGYTSRIYANPSSFPAGLKALYIQLTPPECTRAGVIFPLEGNRCVVTLGGAGKDYPPTDEAGFLDFARSLPSPVLYQAIKGAKPLSPIHGFRGTENRMRHYERLARRPDNFVLVGDAVCAFNPVYGQGMTVSGLGAMALHKCLREQRKKRRDAHLAGFAHRFQRRLAAVNALPWLLATSEDFRVPMTTGLRPRFSIRLVHAYLDQVIMLAAQYPKAKIALAEVTHLLASPVVLFNPDIVARVARQVITRKRRRPYLFDFTWHFLS